MIRLLELFVLSTLCTVIGKWSFHKVILFRSANLVSKKVPAAPESIRAWVSMIQLADSWTGIRMDCFMGSITITGAIVVCDL